MILATAYHATSWTTLGPVLVTNLAGGLFILPFLLFSGLAGQLADRHDQVAVMRAPSSSRRDRDHGPGRGGLAITSLPVLLLASLPARRAFDVLRARQVHTCRRCARIGADRGQRRLLSRDS
ncbi:MAG: hypothetical protein R3E65_12650 [Steroidobacteraceae bacterium]